ncbi:MAG: NmrA family NAD(P)-binding protein [Nitrospirae bacterium]|jgi:uncharacterized protein YbjT (DUF2867 family)|nr:NmrA family NAD(P)-binding protein [Nitrospirota bacterium]
MKVLVLQATGQLGANLVRALLAKGKQVRALVACRLGKRAKGVCRFGN